MLNRNCEKCGYTLGYSMKFCPICGTPAPAIETEYSSSPQTHSQPQLYPDMILYPKPTNDTNTPEPAKKGLKNWLIALIVCSAITLTVIIGLITVLNFKDSLIPSKNPSSQEKAFSTGYVEDGYYINEWANISFSVENFGASNKRNVYEKFEHNGSTPGGMQFGFVSVDRYKHHYDFILEFEWVGKNYDDDDYISLMVKRFQDLYEEDPEVQCSEKVIAGDTYLVAKLSCVFTTKYICVKIQGDYAVCFITDTNSFHELSNIKEIYPNK